MDFDLIIHELKFKTSRSGGAGGQNVNKVATKVELLFNVCHSEGLNERERSLIKHKLGNKIDVMGVLHLSSTETRSQLKNKELVISRLQSLLVSAIKEPKKRKPTKPKASAVQKRLDAKKKRSQKKESRRFNPNKD